MIPQLAQYKPYMAQVEAIETDLANKAAVGEIVLGIKYSKICFFRSEEKKLKLLRKYFRFFSRSTMHDDWPWRSLHCNFVLAASANEVSLSQD